MKRRWLFAFVLASSVLLYLFPGFAQELPKVGAQFIHCQHTIDGSKPEGGKCAATPDKPVAYKNKKFACTDCHQSEKIADKNWRPGHRPCVECHKRDFLKSDATICYNCHITNDPAQKPPKFKPLPKEGSEPDNRKL
jgi:hypothetical protein